MLINSKRKFILYLLTIFIFAVKVTFPVFDDSGTVFTFTLEDKYSTASIESITPDAVPDTEKAARSAEFSSPKTGDEILLILRVILTFGSSYIIAVLYLGKFKNSKKRQAGDVKA